MTSFEPKSIAILGAGITGLVAAHRLTRRGHRIRIFERSGRAGGAVRTEREQGWLIEAGPNSVMSGEPALETLLQELSLSQQVIEANPSAKNRYIVRNRALVPVPLSPPALLTSRLFSPLGKARLLSDLLSRPRARTNDVPLADLVGSHAGTEFVDYALNPFVSGVYAGNPSRLSARYAFPKLWQMEQKYGSLIRGRMAEAKERKARADLPAKIFSFPDGLETLTRAIVERLPDGCIASNSSLEAITPGEKWNVIWHHADATHTQAFDAIIVALPAPSLASLRVGALGERPLAALDGMEHPPLSSLFLGFRREQVSHALDGFGVLVPAVENRSVLGILFSSSLFPGRAPDGQVALTVMIGGTRQPELAVLPTDQLLQRIRPDLGDLLGVTGEPTFVRHTFWPRAIPQYNLGHERYLAAVAELEASHPGLFIGGQARDGISLPACVAAGERLASQVKN